MASQRMTDEDIIRAVRSIRYASKHLRNGRRRLSVNKLARLAGITRDTVYQVTRRGTMSPETANKFRAVLGDPDTGPGPV